MHLLNNFIACISLVKQYTGSINANNNSFQFALSYAAIQQKKTTLLFLVRP